MKKHDAAHKKNIVRRMKNAAQYMKKDGDNPVLECPFS